MRDLKRNQRKMYYSLYIEQENDSDFDVLDTVAKYSAPVEFKASLTAGKSDSDDSPFGKDISYDRIISTVKKDLPITETSLIWYETEPILLEDGSANPDSADYKVAAAPLDGLDGIRIAIKSIAKSNVPKNDKKDDVTEDNGNKEDNSDSSGDDLEDW
ncbi:hypothetical protein [Butyribacter intestini]|uniref:Phage major tail protein, TP901-1 family n=1 Tax=Butyribacter intestini TaxID=1703332 RepID=A0AAW3JU08_9FIRM|nr:hypothetical protein APZ18_02250 [Butyribacter intestini]RHU77141.1 hypothetical protein DXC30_02290 [Butyribacter intestini]